MPPYLFCPGVDKRGELFYYIDMTEFTDEKLLCCLKKRQIVNLCAGGCFFAALISALCSAAAASLMDDSLTAVIILLCLALAFLAITVALLAVGYRLSAGAEDIIYPLIAKEFYSCEGLLKPDEQTQIELEVTLVGDVMRILRRSFRGDVAFDLKDIKKSHGAYSSFGVKVLEFITGYYQKNSFWGTVEILDNVSAKPEKITVVKGGAVQPLTHGNQFIKRGLIL